MRIYLEWILLFSFVELIQNVCINNAGGCVACFDSNACQICESGKYVDNATDECFDCPIGCSECSSSTQCTVCESSFDSNSSICQCPLGNGLNIINRTCMNCQSIGCQNCKNDYQICQNCADYYGFNSTYQCQLCTDTNCLKCSQNYHQCTQCIVSYGFQLIAGFNVCRTCLDTKCQDCYNNYNICNKCITDYIMDNIVTKICLLCTTPNCIKCRSINNYCIQCINAYTAADGICVLCTVPNCKICSVDINICQSCKASYGLITSNNTCTRCADINCYYCGANYQICINCFPKLYIGLYNASCVNCFDSHCLFCRNDANKCYNCTYGYGVLSPSKICAVCSDYNANCLKCSYNVNDCQLCGPQYGVNTTSNYKWRNCFDTNCYNCSTNYKICRQCKIGYGFDSNLICQTCPSNCLLCSNFTYCIQCKTHLYLQLGACYPCPSSCKQCTNSTKCIQCYNGDYLYNNNCVKCPNLCDLCFYNPLYSKPQCALCANGSAQLNTDLPPICADICGDSYAFLLPCDNQIGVPYDGCTDTCQIQDGFQCYIDNTSNYKGVCSYNSTLSMQVMGWKRINKYQNRVQIVIKIFPPLNVFKQSSDSQLKQVFQLGNDKIVIQDIHYEKKLGDLIFTADFNTEFVQQEEFVIYFLPKNSTNLQYYATKSQYQKLNIYFNQQPVYIYSSQVLVIDKVILYCSWVILILGWLGLIQGIFFRKLAGLEAMLVIQFSWITILQIKKPLLLPLQQIFPLKYSSGFNQPFLSQSINFLLYKPPPHIQSFRLNLLLLNNYNISYLLIIVPLIVTVLLWVYLKILSNRFLESVNTFNDEQMKSQFQNQGLQNLLLKQKYYQFSVQCTMYGTMLNLWLLQCQNPQ